MARRQDRKADIGSCYCRAHEGEMVKHNTIGFFTLRIREAITVGFTHAVRQQRQSRRGRLARIAHSNWPDDHIRQISADHLDGVVVSSL